MKFMKSYTFHRKSSHLNISTWHISSTALRIIRNGTVSNTCHNIKLVVSLLIWDNLQPYKFIWKYMWYMWLVLVTSNNPTTCIICCLPSFRKCEMSIRDQWTERFFLCRQVYGPCEFHPRSTTYTPVLAVLVTFMLSEWPSSPYHTSKVLNIDYAKEVIHL